MYNMYNIRLILALESASAFILIEFLNSQGNVRLPRSLIFFGIFYITIVEHYSFRTTLEACSNFFELVSRSLRKIEYISVFELSRR